MLMLRAHDTPTADVFITHELQNRAPKKTDYLAEKLALQDLAACMADQPEDVLPRFVDLAIEMTGGVSAGLSLYEENPAPGVFRWTYLRGTLSPFNGATTPRNFSPCGITLDQNAPVLSRHPERFYNWISDANIIVPEVLLVPLYLGGKVPLGTLWIVSDKEGHFDSGHARAMTELASFVGIALRMVRSEQHLQQALNEQQTLTREMNHRVKNLFAVTDALIRMSARGATDKDEMAKVLSGRLHALASAHSLVRRSYDDIGGGPRASDLRALVKTILKPHAASSDAESRFSIEGPSIQCGDHAINGIALVFHELATNAAKYGALTLVEGHVDISWKQQDDKLLIGWVERNGPPIEVTPTVNGFGSTLARTTVVGQFRGTLDYDWQREGLTVTIALPIDALAA
ncbi:MAG TPA: HWE histidine kinase domain-containing protein [Beijerinckiaceae bacterium]|jgi:two-component sensor histidine kinase|nr:HWE histidine kinase domain-containing protein [Beijerinckiaceae bacterium]